MKLIDQKRAEVAAKLEASRKPELHAHVAPAGYRLRGVSTLLGPDGQAAQTWVKTEKAPADPQAVLDAFRLAIELDPIPAAQRVRLHVSVPEEPDTHRLTVYPMGDPHFGMLAWPLETGNDFNLEIARRQLLGAMTHLVALAPATETALLLNLGDFLHADNFEARTARSGHALDVDSRYPKILRCAIWTLIEMCKLALTKHRRVKLVNVKGNHDDQSSIMLALCLAAHFANEPRVEIEESPAMFHKHRFGVNLLGTTHGHTIKGKDLPLLMAADWAEDWGATTYRHWYTGHVHHESVKEHAGATVETFRTLAAKDAWHAGQGYRAHRAMVCDVWHEKWGKVLRHSVGVEQLDAEHANSQSLSASVKEPAPGRCLSESAREDRAAEVPTSHKVVSKYPSSTSRARKAAATTSQRRKKS